MRITLLYLFLAASLFGYCQTGTMPIVEKVEGDISAKTIQEGDTTVNTAPKIFSFVEQMPEFPGGNEALNAFIQNNIQYPEYEKHELIMGKVFVRFIVNEDGHISNATVQRGVTENLDKEALRVVSLLPAFKPGLQQGKAVKVYYIAPIMFKLMD